MLLAAASRRAVAQPGPLATARVMTRAFSGVAAARERVQREIEANKGVLMYSKSYCSFSAGAKEVFRTGGVDVTVHELDLESDGVEVQKALLEETGQRTVPNIFIGKAHVGGYTELMEGIKDGHIDDLLEVVNMKMSIA